MSDKPKVFLTSNVFSSEEIGANEKISQSIRDKINSLWDNLNSISKLRVYEGRFPSEEELKTNFNNFKPNFIGCHLSHKITREMLKNPEIYAISTSTAGYNHIQRLPKDDILITHTPGVLHETVADYTIALIMATLRNLIDLHDYVWAHNWTPEDKWDLDQNLSSIINNKILGIVGLGEIGIELVKRLSPWGLKILYFDINRKKDIEDSHPNLKFKENLKDLFIEADIVSLHIPLNKHTEKIINRDLLKSMKKGAVLINTARGPVLDLEALLDLLEHKEIQINFAFDVFPIEPIDKNTLDRIKKIKKEQPHIRMLLMPHNASADADTRGKMDILFLEDLITIIKSKKIEDLNGVHSIPEHTAKLSTNNWRIEKYWEDK